MIGSNRRIDDYHLISVEAGVPDIQNCEECRDGSIRTRHSCRIIDTYILAAIAYNLHQLDDGVMPDDFPTKVTKPIKDAISIGDWQFLDRNRLPSRMSRFSTNFISTLRPLPVCCIGV